MAYIQREIEDILNLIDGREELLQELPQAAIDVKAYLMAECKTLLNSPDIVYAAQSTAGGNTDREKIIFDRIENIIAATSLSPI